MNKGDLVKHKVSGELFTLLQINESSCDVRNKHKTTVVVATSNLFAVKRKKKKIL